MEGWGLGYKIYREREPRPRRRDAQDGHLAFGVECSEIQVLGFKVIL